MIKFDFCQHPDQYFITPTLGMRFKRCDACEDVHAVIFALGFLVWSVALVFHFNPPPSTPHA